MPKKSNSQLMRLRARRGLSQDDIAQSVGVTKKTISNWETGHSIPRLTPRQYKDLLTILNITSDELPDHFGPPENEKEFSALKRLRLQAGMSGKELAEILSGEDKVVTEEEIQILEDRRQVTFTIPQTQAICKAFGISIDDLASLFKET